MDLHPDIPLLLSLFFPTSGGLQAWIAYYSRSNPSQTHCNISLAIRACFCPPLHALMLAGRPAPFCFGKLWILTCSVSVESQIVCHPPCERALGLLNPNFVVDVSFQVLLIIYKYLPTFYTNLNSKYPTLTPVHANPRPLYFKSTISHAAAVWCAPPLPVCAIGGLAKPASTSLSTLLSTSTLTLSSSSFLALSSASKSV